MQRIRPTAAPTARQSLGVSFTGPVAPGAEPAVEQEWAMGAHGYVPQSLGPGGSHPAVGRASGRAGEPARHGTEHSGMGTRGELSFYISVMHLCFSD